MTPEQIAAARALVDAATKGPWRVGPVDDCRVEDADGNEVAMIDGDYNHPDTWPLMEANAAFIAWCRDGVPAILDALAAAQAERDAWRDQCRDPLLGDFAKALEDHRESIPAAIWSHIDALQKQIDFSANGKYGPVYSGPMVDAAFARVATAEARAADLTAKLEAMQEVETWQIKQRADAMARRYMNAPEDPQVRAICERYGYGAVMDAASRLWARKDSLGAFYIGGCVGFRSDDEARAALNAGGAS